MEQQLELSAAYCNRWIISKQKINIYTKQLNEAKYMIGWGEDVFSARWNDGIRGIKWWLSLPKNFIQIFFGMYAILGIIMVLINSIFPVVPYWATYTFNQNRMSFTFYFGLALLVLTGGIILLAAIIMDSDYKKDWKNFIKKQKETKENIIPKLHSLIESEKREVDNLEYHMVTLGECIIPQKYWQYGDILYGYIQDRRANSLSEAINLLVFEQRQNYNTQLLEQSEQHARETKELARISAQNSEIAAKEAERAADNAEIAAWFSAMAYFGRKK